MALTILFDLDGTLTDPKVGITKSIAFALESLGAPVPSADELEWCIGPPLHESFTKILGDGKNATKALDLYRQRFADIGIFENQLYNGVVELLHTLTKNGFSLFVATSKPKIFADKIIDHFGLRPYFNEVYGSELDGTRSDKGDLIAHIIATLGLKPQHFLMVGDRKHDMIGATKNQVKCVGASWGYGSHEELMGSGAEKVMDQPSDLAKYILADPNFREHQWRSL